MTSALCQDRYHVEAPPTNERPIRVSSVARVEETHPCFGTLRTLDEQRPLPVTTVGQSVRDRGLGVFWGHVLVAQGSAEAMLDLGVSVWDLAAPAAIVAEAGGRMTDLAGRLSSSGSFALTSNGLLHDTLLSALGGRTG